MILVLKFYAPKFVERFLWEFFFFLSLLLPKLRETILLEKLDKYPFILVFLNLLFYTELFNLAATFFSFITRDEGINAARCHNTIY